MPVYQHILLFDMDGVLLYAGGYHRALQETVARVAHLLGYGSVSLTQADIDQFVAAGATSEWDSSAICAALLLLRLWERLPQVRLPNPEDLRDSFQPTIHDLPAPDFSTFASRLAEKDLKIPARQRAKSLLLTDTAEHSPAQREALQSILDQAHQPETSLTHRLFQEYVLGSRVFEATYQFPPSMAEASYLERFDQPALTPIEAARLRDWLGGGDRRAAILTNRPSLPPAGRFGTPEAEMGARLAGLPGIPIAGLGHIEWLCANNCCQIDDSLKPSPVHALAALQFAISDGSKPQEELLLAAYAALQTPDPAAWRPLHGTRVSVFEDSSGGLRSAEGARQILNKIGIDFQLNRLGITLSEPKRLALEKSGAWVFPSLSAALSAEGIL